MLRLRTLAFFLSSVVIVLIFSQAGLAVTITGSASVDRIETNGIFEWHVTVKGTTTTPTVKTFTPFSLVGGPSTSTSIQIMNGSISNSIELGYVLRAPGTPGTYPLPVATITSGGQTVSSQASNLEVVAQGQAGGGAPPPATRGQPNRGGRQVQQAPQPAQRNTSELAWIEVSSTDRTVFVGERVRVTYRIFFQSARNLQITDLPQGSGYSMESARDIKEYKVERAERNGRAYNSSVIFDQWVIPSRSGTIEVPPLEAQVDIIQQVQRRNDPFSMFNDPFGMFSNPFQDAQVVPIKVKSPKVVITAKPLPGGQNINDAWIGSYQASVSISPQSVPVHSSSTIVVNLKGNSELRTLQTPELLVPGSVEAYPPVVKIYGDGDQIRKEIRYPVIPRAPGKFGLGFQAITTFDPSTQKYGKILADTIWLTAEGTAGGPMATYTAPHPNTMSGQEQLPIPTIEHQDRPLQTLKTGWYLTSGVILAGLVGMGFVRHQSGRTTQERTKHRGVKKKLYDKISSFQLGSEKESEDIERILSEYLTVNYKAKEKITHPEHLQKIADPMAQKWMEQWQVLRDLRYQPSSIVEGMVAEWKKISLGLIEGKN